MAFDPVKVLSDYSDADCTVQFLIPGMPAVAFSSIKQAVAHVRDNQGKWKDVEITVHLDREDITFGTDKSHMLIDALRPRRRG